MRLGGDHGGIQAVDFRLRDSERRSRDKDAFGGQRAAERSRMQCERVERALSSSTQATIEVDLISDSIGFSPIWPALVLGARHGLFP